jgi:chromosomal replication initiation ATPase DnaA
VKSSPAPQQIPLPFEAFTPRYRREDYVFTAVNREWMARIKRFLDSGEAAVALCGPEGSGKTHIVHMLAEELGGATVSVRALSSAPAEARLVIADDAQDAGDPRSFLGGLEKMRETRRALLLVGRGDPPDWSGGLQDLGTRLSAMPRVTLEEPDEALMRSVMAKLFAARQLRVSERVVEYAAPRLPRTFSAAGLFVGMAEAEMRRSGEPIGLALAKRVVDSLSEGVRGS